MWEQRPDGRVVHRFEPVILVLALLIVPVALVEESHASRAVEDAAAAANWVIWVGFLVEIVAVMSVAPRKRAALRAHAFDAAIVVVSAPVLPGLLAALRAARLLRLLRLARLGMLGGRAVRAEHVFASREAFRYVALLTGMLVALAGATISVADSRDFPNIGLGMWWAVSTVTTVGYGDVVPHTVLGRIIASLLMLVGIGFLSMLTATIASSFVVRDSAEAKVTLADVMAKLEDIERRLDAADAR
jgi:voltage-gated potassium channel